MEFIEAHAFTKYLYDYLSEEEYIALQLFLTWQTEAGVVVPGSGGVRKLRWGQDNRGKRGGLRIIYYLITPEDTIVLLTLYAKNEEQNIPGHILRMMKEEIERGRKRRK